MSLVIGFSALKVHCSVGIHPHEKKQLQDIFISLKVRLSHVPSLFHETIDYSALAELCTTHALGQHYDLIESLAILLVEDIFARFPCAHVWIGIEKPAALPAARVAFVEYEKGR